MTFKTHESAVKAIAEKNGSNFQDRQLVVEKRRDYQDPPSVYDERTIILTASRVTREDVQSRFPFDPSRVLID